MKEELKRTELDRAFCKKFKLLVDGFSSFFAKGRKLVEKIIYQRKSRGHRASKIVKSRKSYSNGHLPYHLFILLLISRALMHDVACEFAYAEGSAETISANVLKAGIHMKAVFWLGFMFLKQISRLNFKQSRISMLIPHIYVLGLFVKFLVIFRHIWR